MQSEFYGAKVAAQQTINNMLALPATGREQDWEFELAAPDRIEDMLALAQNSELDYDERSALSLLTLASVEEAALQGKLDKNLLEKAIAALRADRAVFAAMRFFWVDLDKMEDKKLLERIFFRHI